MMRLAVATGGTGGHIFPALAVASEVRRRYPDVRVLFMGGPGPEGRLAAEAGLEFKKLPARGILGKGLAGKLQSAWVVGATAKALKELMRFKPQAVVGFGGYAGFCPVLAAWMLRIPTAVHEQNSVPGLVNRVLGRLARRVFTSFEDIRGAFPASKTMRTGNPVREPIARLFSENGFKAGRNLLVLGGSQGARAINQAVTGALAPLSEAGISIRHQSGPDMEEETRRAYAEAGADPSRVSGFITDMAAQYAEADLIVARAGASTVFEVACAGKPAIFIPFPHATHDHQLHNARALEDLGAAVVLDQVRADSKPLGNAIIELMNDPDRLRSMSRAAKSFAAPHAARDIVDEITRMSGHSGRNA